MTAGQQRAFRFGVSVRDAGSVEELAAQAVRAEELGFDTFLCPDHLIGSDVNYLAMWPMMTVAALSTSRIRIGNLVACNDFRAPALLAKEAATLDWLSGGRLELGLGAGHRAAEYEQSGLPFYQGPVRIERLEEAIKIVKALFEPAPVQFEGRHYQINGLQQYPPPLQRPRPPLLVGGGARRVLELAAREADIVSIIQRALPDGRAHDWRDLEAAATERQINWMRAASPERFDRIELSTLIQGVAITDDRPAAAERLAVRYGGSAERILESALFLLGPIEQACEQLIARRKRYGISYYVVFGRDMEAFAPVVKQLRGA
ncbi:MAG: TIGR03621 family F420-dependent LLM class oxidoreductase [Actinobacteria bacterium]|nr:TIGR03621 family F420-dependent LLM class oxidoreductase [Actinomycetota bacterium]